MKRRRAILLLWVIAALVMPFAPVEVAADGDPAADTDRAAVGFTGIDGAVYESAPEVVTGPDGYLFLGAELDMACGLGRRIERSLKAYAQLARVISRSGRRVVFTVVPNKSVANPAHLVTPLPHGSCDARGLAEQAKVLQGFDDPDYLSLLKPLAAGTHQTWWKTDTHWTTAGAAIYAKALATELDPALGRRQKYRYGTETRVGYIHALMGSDVPETIETAFPRTKVKVRTAKGGPDWAGYPEGTFEHAWNTRPARRTWPGRTLLLGDSFMWYALQNLRPLFRHGHYVWIEHTGVDVPRAIKKSDTVVIELFQLFMPGQRIASKEFRKEVSRVLRRR